MKQLTPHEFLEREIAMGVSATNPSFIALAEATANQFAGQDISRVLDYGAGTGVYSDAFQRLVCVNTYAFDIWESHRAYIQKHFPNVLLTEYPITTDLMLFIEVAEHMTDKELNDLFKQIKPKQILFSSTPYPAHNDEEWGHINIKQKEDWIKFFAKKKYILESELSLPTPWTLLFKLK